jgi:hydrophobe/amphiphile efflux-3 (HAE3) family protein
VRAFWSNLAVQLGKRAPLVGAVCLVLTVVLGFGLSKLEFATGQDSYLNSDEQIAVDNVAYQDLFGGQIMITLFTLDEGTTHADMVTGENRQVFLDVFDELCGEIVDDACTANPTIRSVVTPIHGLELANALIQAPYDDPASDTPASSPLEAIAGTVLGDAIEREEPGSPAQMARQTDQSRTACRLLGITLDGSACDQTGFGSGDGLSLDPTRATLTDPEWVDFLLHGNDGSIRRSLQTFFPDEGHAVMITRLAGNASIDIEGEGALAVKAAWADRRIEGTTITVTGAPVLLKDLNDYLKGGLVQLGGIAVVVMAGLLLVLFNVRWRLLPLGVILVACIWTFGLAGYLGVPLSVVTIAGLPVLLGMGIDYAIQVHARVEEEVIIDRADHPIQETSRQLMPGLVATTTIAVLAFVSLQVARVPMIRDFGVLLALGIAVVLVASAVIPLAALGHREYRSPTQGGDFRTGALGRLVVRLGSLPPVMAVPFVVASAAIFVGGLAVEGELQLQTDVVQWVNQETQNRKDVATLHREADTSSELGTYVIAPFTEALFTDETVAWVHAYTQDQLDRFPDQLKRASSIVTPLSYLLEIDGASDLPPTGEQVRKTYEAAPDAIRAFTVSTTEGSTALNVLHTTRPSTLAELSVVVDHIRDTADPPDELRATPSGLAVVGVGLLQNLETGRAQLTYLAIGVVFLFLALRLRSLVRGVLCLVPVLIATGAASLVAFALDLKLSPMTAVGGPIVIAVCAEFTTLILWRFVEDRNRGLHPQAASDVAAARTGRAFILSALTGVVGVAVIATSSLPILRDFGIIVAMNVIVALLSALVVLPPMLVWADRPGRHWVSGGLVPDEVLATATLDHDESVPTTPDLGHAGPIPGRDR